MGAQLVLIDGGPMVRPVELTLGLRRARRSRAKAWRLLCAIEKADSHEALAATWQKVIAARVRKQLDQEMELCLGRAWERSNAVLKRGRK